jgi:hypothetical protein
MGRRIGRGAETDEAITALKNAITKVRSNQIGKKERACVKRRGTRRIIIV